MGMCGLMHKPFVGSFWHLMLWQPKTSEKKVLAQSFQVQQPQLRLVSFFCCHGAATEHQVLQQTYKNSYRNTQNAGRCLWKWSYLSHTCIWTVWNIQSWMWGPSQCSRCGWTSTTWWNLWTTAKAHELVARDCQIILKWMNDQLHSHWETRCQILHNYLGKRVICVKSDPHNIVNGIGVTTCKDFTHIDQTKSNFLKCIITRVSVQPLNNVR